MHPWSHDFNSTQPDRGSRPISSYVSQEFSCNTWKGCNLAFPPLMLLIQSRACKCVCRPLKPGGLHAAGACEHMRFELTGAAAAHPVVSVKTALSKQILWHKQAHLSIQWPCGRSPGARESGGGSEWKRRPRQRSFEASAQRERSGGRPLSHCQLGVNNSSSPACASDRVTLCCVRVFPLLHRARPVGSV